MSAPASTTHLSTNTATSAGREAATTTRDRLLAAAVDLLIEKGSFEQVSLRAIAAGAGVTPTAVYRHFADHAALLEAVAAWCWERFDAAVFGGLFVDGEPAADFAGAGDQVVDSIERFLESGTAYVEFARQYPGIYRVLMDQRFDDVSRVADGRAVFAKLVALVDAMLLARGDERDRRHVALLVHTWIHGIATLQLPLVADQLNTAELLVELVVALGLAPR